MFYSMINGTVYTVPTFIVFMLEMLVLSPLIGFLIGCLTFWLTRRTSRPTDLHIDFQIAFTIIAAYSSYYIAGALLGISGVLACCTAGVTVAVLVNPSIIEHHKMHEVWELMEWVCNTLIFLLGGFIGGQHTYKNITIYHSFILVALFLLLIVSRAAMVGLLFPIISKVGMKLSVRDAVFVTAAGLRGALGKEGQGLLQLLGLGINISIMCFINSCTITAFLAIALALDASHNANDNGDSDLGGEFFFIITGLVSMTLLINGSTSGICLVYGIFSV
jgi:NhaP-type Na+/H+ or K+/H+ antiporter